MCFNLIVLTVFAMVTDGVCGLQCLSCGKINNPSDCTAVITCQPDQICFTARLTENTSQFYLQGCSAAQTCQSNNSRAAGDTFLGRRGALHAQCVMCCSDSYCNHEGCKVLGTTQAANHTLAFWEEWSPWTHCDVTCGKGRSVRIRTCSDPADGACAGPVTDERPCQSKSCCFDQYVECTQPDFLGAACQSPSAATFCQKSCDLCVVDGGWTDWSPWGGCAKGCGDETRQRVRNCTNPAPKNGGAVCVGPSSELLPCDQAPCPVDGHWTAWYPWTPCDVSCGNGNSFRVRKCTNPAPAHGGKDCPSTDHDFRTCHQPSCPVVTTAPATPALTTKGSLLTCTDDPECADPGFLRLACKDLYIASTYCPRRCHICGPATTPPTGVCEDKASDQCRDPAFISLICSDPDVVHLCERSCHVCH